MFELGSRRRTNKEPKRGRSRTGRSQKKGRLLCCPVGSRLGNVLDWGVTCGPTQALFSPYSRPNHTLASVPMTAKSLLTFGSIPLGYWAAPQHVSQHLKSTHSQLTEHSHPDFILCLYSVSQAKLSISPQRLTQNTGSHLTCSFLRFLSISH